MEVPKVVTDVLRVAAPTLLTGLLGPLGGIVATLSAPLLEKWLGPLPPDTKVTPQLVAEKIQENSSDPELLERLRKVERTLQQYEDDQGFKFAELEVKERQSNRDFQNEAGIAPALVKWGMGIVVFSMTMQFLTIAGCIFLIAGIFKIPFETASMAAGVFGLIGTVVGYIAGYASQIIGFYWGGSKGRTDENNALTDALQQSGEQLGQAAVTAAATASKAAEVAAAKPAQPQVVVVPTPPVQSAPAINDSGNDWEQGPFGGVRFKLTADGVLVDGESKPARTVGEPVTVRRIWRDFAPYIQQSCAVNGVPLELVVATIATESRGKVDALLTEPDGRQSLGLMQVLTGTASEVMGRAVSAQELIMPEIGIEAGTRYIKSQYGKTKFLPPFVAAAYNAGGLYEPRAQDKNRWKLRSTGDHVDRLVLFFNDCCFVAKQDGWSQ